MKEQFQSIIQSSSLTKAQKELWERFLTQANQSDIKAVVEVVSEDPSLLSLLTENLEKKIQAFKQGDEKVWDAILEEEKDAIEAYENKKT